MAARTRSVFVGAGGFVAALRCDTGEEQWRTRLPSSSGSSIVTLLLEGNLLLAGHCGRLYGLNARDGTVLWKNKLPKMKFGAVTMTVAGAGNSVEVAVAQSEADRRAAAAAGAAGAASA